jgi:DNA polymerase V
MNTTNAYHPFKSALYELISPRAISTYISRAAEKLRREQLLASAITVFVMGNRFQPHAYSNATTLTLPVATSSTPEPLHVALQGAKTLYRDCAFKKAGVILMGLVPERQLGLFDSQNRARDEKLMATLDQINQQLEAGTLSYAAAGLNPGWRLKATRRSPRYTTHWQELAVVRA